MFPVRKRDPLNTLTHYTLTKHTYYYSHTYSTQADTSKNTHRRPYMHTDTHSQIPTHSCMHLTDKHTVPTNHISISAPGKSMLLPFSQFSHGHGCAGLGQTVTVLSLSTKSPLSTFTSVSCLVAEKYSKSKSIYSKCFHINSINVSALVMVIS